MVQEGGKIGILVGGGPAPGINSVISGVTIEARNRGFEVIGIYEGFKKLAMGIKETSPLSIQEVSRIHLDGGSILKTSRFNPTRDEAHLKMVVKTLIELGVTHLVTVGGDDTAYASYRVSCWAKEQIGEQFRTVHVPKTIDNDLPLPEGIPTFGFETARELGTQIVTNLMEDAKTTGRWFLAVAMGRKTGHLALGIGKSAGATLMLIPEAFFPGKVRLKTLTDIIAGAIIKRLSQNRPYGVAVLAEGLLECLDDRDLSDLADVERDPYGNIRLAEVDFSDIIKNRVKERLKSFDIKMTIVDKEIGYEVRCASPSAFDIEYTRNLGFGAVELLEQGATDVMVTIRNNQIQPIRLQDIMDPATGRTEVRKVNTESVQYRIARQYMIQLEPSDFQQSIRLKQMALVAHCNIDAFRREFEYLVKAEKTEHPSGKDLLNPEPSQ